MVPLRTGVWRNSLWICDYTCIFLYVYLLCLYIIITIKNDLFCNANNWTREPRYNLFGNKNVCMNKKAADCFL